MFGVLNPAWAVMPCTPRNSRSTCSVPRAATAIGPTRASLGVRTPPVRIIVRSARGWLLKTSATRTLLVTTVRFATVASRPARCHVVVPAVRPIALPSWTKSAAARGDRRFLGRVAQRLGVEARLVAGVCGRGRGAAVDLDDEPGVVEGVEVAPHGHVADARAVRRGRRRAPRRGRAPRARSVPDAAAPACDSRLPCPQHAPSARAQVNRIRTNSHRGGCKSPGPSSHFCSGP